MALITGSGIFSQIGLSGLNCGILRILIMFKKKALNTLAVSLSPFIILSASINVFFSLEMTLLDKHGFTTF